MQNAIAEAKFVKPHLTSILRAMFPLSLSAKFAKAKFAKAKFAKAQFAEAKIAKAKFAEAKRMQSLNNV